MGTILTILGIAALLIWFVKGITSDRVSEARKEAEYIDKIVKDTLKADDNLRKPSRLERVRSLFNKRSGDS